MTRNVAASVRQRLLNKARAEGRPFGELLQYFVLERFLYRLGRSPYAPRFILKGALIFGAWQGAFSRPTRDVDLLGRLDHTVEHITGVIKAICQETVPDDDGLRFDAASVVGERIIEAANYEGVRVRLVAYLETARVPVRVDVAFGDPLVPGPYPVRLPTILDFAPPELQGYSRESVIAEKFQAMVYLGLINSRMKDFYDIWLLAGRFEFDGPILAQAIRETFRWRQTVIPARPVAFSEAFIHDHEKQAQWGAFIRRHQLDLAPPTLMEAIQVIAALLQPVIQTLVDEQLFNGRWQPGGPWI
jgi:hypothetical protein